MKVIYIKKKYLYISLILLVLLMCWYFSNRQTITTLYLPITNKVIGIDPGHGGIDPGAVGKNGISENEINLSICLKLKRFIEQSGGVVVITRDDTRGLYTDKSNSVRDKKTEDLKNRMELINSSNCDIFLTIHLNSFPQSKYYGAQTFYSEKCSDSWRLANVVQEELKNILDTDNKRKPQKRDDVYLLQEAHMPSILIECGFLSNPREELLLSDEEYQEKIAWAIYIGIIKYLNERDFG